MNEEQFYTELIGHKVAIAQLCLQAIPDLEDDDARKKAIDTLADATEDIIKCTQYLSDNELPIPDTAQAIISALSGN